MCATHKNPCNSSEKQALLDIVVQGVQTGTATTTHSNTLGYVASLWFTRTNRCRNAAQPGLRPMCYGKNLVPDMDAPILAPYVSSPAISTSAQFHGSGVSPLGESDNSTGNDEHAK